MKPTERTSQGEHAQRVAVLIQAQLKVKSLIQTGTKTPRKFVEQCSGDFETAPDRAIGTLEHLLDDINGELESLRHKPE